MEVRVLGALEVLGDDGPVPLSAPKHRRLLAALVLADGQTRSPDQLIDAVWGEAPPASARNLLQVYVSQVRKMLPAEANLVTRTAGYALRLPPDAVDAKRFEGLLDEGREAAAAGNPALAASLLRRALELWRGPALADVANGGPAFHEATRLDELRLGCLEDRIAADLELGRHDEALAELASLVAAHPLRERLRAHQMLALYRSGRQADALEAFRQARRALVEELGLEPGAELRALQQRILKQDATLEATGAAERASALPVPPVPLVGRRDELEALRALLGRSEARLVVLTGAGGSGKTRLALEVARELADTYADGAVLVELGALSDPDLVVPTIAREVGVGEDTPIDALVSALASREHLLVVDNAEHLRTAAPAYVQLLSGAARLTLLVTSRTVLHLTGEHVFPVAPLEEDDAVELFVRRARAAAPSFTLTDEVEADVRAICRRVDGLPLALELAAARITMLDSRSLLARLSSRLTVLAGGPRDLPARQQTLRETLDWSVGLLGPSERGVLARLSVFPGGATFEAAEEVCRADLDTLSRLVDGNLVRRVDAGDAPRFGLLETVREYSLELLGDDRDETERAFATHLLGLVEEAYESTEESAWMARLEVELDNLRSALDWAAAGSYPELELLLAGGLWRFWWARGHVDEGLSRLDAALARPTGEGSPARARALRGLAGLAWSRGRLDLAESRATEALALARDFDNPHEALGAHTILGNLANQRKDFETARRHHEQSLAIRESLGREPVVEKLNLAVVAMDSGDPGAAVPLFEDVLDSNRRGDNLVGVVGFATLNLGQAHYRLGDIASARERFQEARRAFSEIGFRAHVAHALQGLAACDVSCGRHEEAARLLGRAAAELGEIVDSDEDFLLLVAELEATVRGAIGDEAYEAAYAAGRSG